jgi:hypothetical protein
MQNVCNIESTYNATDYLLNMVIMEIHHMQSAYNIEGTHSQGQTKRVQQRRNKKARKDNATMFHVTDYLLNMDNMERHHMQSLCNIEGKSLQDTRKDMQSV